MDFNIRRYLVICRWKIRHPVNSESHNPQSRTKVSFIITALLIGLVFLGLRLLVSYPQLSAVYFQVIMKSPTDDVAKVYYDLGEGLSEKDSTEVQIMGDQRFHDYRFKGKLHNSCHTQLLSSLEIICCAGKHYKIAGAHAAYPVFCFHINRNTPRCKQNRS